MSVVSPSVQTPAQRFEADRARLQELRAQASARLSSGATGIQVAALLADGFDLFLAELMERAVLALPWPQQELLRRNSAVIAVGGTGRGELSPWSDIDLLFLSTSGARSVFENCCSAMIRDCWDAGLKLGHSVRTPGDAIAAAKQDPQFATSLVETRLLWGEPRLHEQLRTRFTRRVIKARRGKFIEGCIEARDEERVQHGAAVQQLVPDVKRSLGGLRDVHLIRWIGFARYGTADLNTLRLNGALAKDEARDLLAAIEFLMKVRANLHFHAGRPQDVLTREEQLRIADEWGYQANAGQRPVERFMQTYFEHSGHIANVARHFVARHRPRTLGARVFGLLMTHRAGPFLVGMEEIDVSSRYRRAILGDLQQILRLYYAAILYGVDLSAPLAARLKRYVPQLSGRVTPEDAKLFLTILSRSACLGRTLRSMNDVGLLQLLIPPFARARGLLQFNQYHSYTVDEHTLRAVEAAEDLEQDPGKVGEAYRAIGNKELLHLALLLHDLGKGRIEDHSEVGKLLAQEVAVHLSLSAHQTEMLVFLVHKHLQMAHLAFRRNSADPEILLKFAAEVGSPETLRMLFVLTAADLKAVGPSVWTDWKQDLLVDLYERALVVLSGTSYQSHEERHVARIRRHILDSVVPLDETFEPAEWQDWIESQLQAFPPHYIHATSPAKIAADLDCIQRLREGDLIINGLCEPDSGTVEYRIISHESQAEGFFHKVTGALTAKRLEILSAEIATSLGGIVVDRYRVIDDDFAGPVPPERIEEVAAAIREVLRSTASVETLFQRNRRFTARQDSAPISDLPRRVVVDNDSSERCTIIDVFTHDRPALLYTVSHAIFELGLSVVLARIATHSDQVVDVFYVTEKDGRKIHDGERLKEIQRRLTDVIEDFERVGHLLFVK